MSNLDRQLAFGIVFDLKNNKEVNKRRFIDVLKDGLVEFAMKLGLNCGVFVGHPDNIDMPRRQGESVAGIVRYRAFQQGIEKTAKQVLDVVGNQDRSFEKHIVLITDNYNSKEKYHYEKVLILNRGRRLGCKFTFIGLGDKYDRSSFGEFAGDDCRIFHFDDPTTINFATMMEI